MSVLALPLFEDQTPRDLGRWALAAAVVVAVHLGAIGVYLYHHEPDEIGDVLPVSVELAPPDDTVQPEVATEQPPPPQEEQPKPVEQPPPPDAPAIAAEEPKPVEEKKPPPPPPQPPHTRAGSFNPVAPSWQTELFKRLQTAKRYPAEAQERGQEGTVLLFFSIDRNGHVLARHIAHTSGVPALDAEVLQMVDRAQPLPAFPASMKEDKLDLTVPIRFSLR